MIDDRTTTRRLSHSGSNYWLNVDGEKRCRRAQVGLLGDKIGSPRPPLTKVSPRGEAHPRLTRAHVAQGGVTLGPEQGELGANFCYLGHIHRLRDCCHSQFSKFPASSLFVFCAAINKSDFRQIAEASPNLTWTVSGSLPRNITVLLRD
jgi:hypothetical protein